MPFNFEEFELECEEASNYKLQKLYEKYVKLATEGATSYTVGAALAIFTLGASALIGSAIGTATVSNAAAKLAIIKDAMARREDKVKLEVCPKAIAKGLALGSVGLVSNPLGHAAWGACSQVAASGAYVYPGHVAYHPTVVR